MLIVSQDKEEIINFDNANSLWINENSENYNFYIRVAQQYSNTVIGEYNSKERAKEILREIIECATVTGVSNCSYEYADIAIKMKKHALYEMPEK